MDTLYKKELNQKFWSNNVFDNNIRLKIIKIVDNLINEIDFEIPIVDIRLTGSLASFNYNKFSDLDVHIITDFKKINKDVNLVKNALNDKKFIWNLKHDIYLKGHEIEVYFENDGEAHISNGIYSLRDNNWVKEPIHNPPEDVNLYLVKQKTSSVTSLVNRMYTKLQQTTDKQEIKELYNKSKRVKDKVLSIRKEALIQKGEFAVENLVFKQLRNSGIIEKLLDIINGSYDKFFIESLSYNKIVNKFV